MKSYFTLLTFLWFNTQIFAQPKLALDPFRLITVNKHLPANYFQNNGFKSIPQFVSTGNFAKDSSAYWIQFNQWWSKYPGEIKMVEKVISLDEWQKLISKTGSTWYRPPHFSLSESAGPKIEALSPNSESNSKDLSVIAPHKPKAEDPDYSNKKEQWIKNYPEEYKKVNESK